MESAPVYNMYFRCYFQNGDDMNYVQHYQTLSLAEIPKWLEAYRFTHPNCVAISTKCWWNGGLLDQDE